MRNLYAPARGEAGGGGGEVDRSCLGEGGQEIALPLGAPPGEPVAAVGQFETPSGLV